MGSKAREGLYVTLLLHVGRQYSVIRAVRALVLSAEEAVVSALCRQGDGERLRRRAESVH